MKDEIFAIINEEISDLEKERRGLKLRTVGGQAVITSESIKYDELTSGITALENILQRIDRMDETQMELFS